MKTGKFIQATIEGQINRIKAEINAALREMNNEKEIIDILLQNKNPYEGWCKETSTHVRASGSYCTIHRWFSMPNGKQYTFGIKLDWETKKFIVREDLERSLQEASYKVLCKVKPNVFPCKLREFMRKLFLEK